MATRVDVEELKPGLIIFRRSEVKRRRNWYCRIKLPGEDRYKSVSLRTPDLTDARARAFDEDAEVRNRLKYNVPVFNRPFSDIAEDYIKLQEARATVGEITAHRAVVVASIIRAQLNRYVGSTQISLITEERWKGYPMWRRADAIERAKAQAKEKAEAERLAEEAQARGEKPPREVRKVGKDGKTIPKARTVTGKVSDATIRYEMTIFRSVMSYAASKKFIPDDKAFRGKLPLAKVRREEFTPEEYKTLYTEARTWVKATTTQRDDSVWLRNMARNFMLIMCNTGMRPTEAKNLRWRDVDMQKDDQGRTVVVLSVRGKNKARNLVAASNVANYLERVREAAKAKGPDDHVFTNYDGSPTTSLYAGLIENLLTKTKLLMSSSGSRRSTYCFRHTYATFRLTEGVDVYFLAKQMGTSVKMIEDHYGHITPVKNAARILQGFEEWKALPTSAETDAATDPAGEVGTSEESPSGKAAEQKATGSQRRVRRAGA
jgi:integrase